MHRPVQTHCLSGVRRSRRCSSCQKHFHVYFIGTTVASTGTLRSENWITAKKKVRQHVDSKSINRRASLRLSYPSAKPCKSGSDGGQDFLSAGAIRREPCAFTITATFCSWFNDPHSSSRAMLARNYMAIEACGVSVPLPARM